MAKKDPQKTWLKAVQKLADGQEAIRSDPNPWQFQFSVFILCQGELKPVSLHTVMSQTCRTQSLASAGRAEEGITFLLVGTSVGLCMWHIAPSKLGTKPGEWLLCLQI